MNEWLPDSFELQQMDERIARTLIAVRRRKTRRAKAVRAAQWAAGAVSVLALAFFLAPKPNRQEIPSRDAVAQRVVGGERDGARETGNQGIRESEAGGRQTAEAASASAHEVPLSPRPPVPSSPPHLLTSSLPHKPAEVTLSKDPNGVELKWQGDPSKDYVVYRCTSPRFDDCDVAGVVKGTKWTDREADRAPLVFYKVEPKDNG